MSQKNITCNGESHVGNEVASGMGVGFSLTHHKSSLNCPDLSASWIGENDWFPWILSLTISEMSEMQEW